MADYALPSDVAREYLAQLDAAERAELIEHISSMLAENPYEPPRAPRAAVRRAREAPADAPPLAGAPPPADAPSADAAPPPLISLTRTFALDDDPRAAIAINDAHRNADVGEDDLWSIDQVRTVLPRQYKYPVPTFAPRRWPTAKPTTQSEYNVRFQAEYPEVASILPISNVVVAGGAAAWALGESSVKTSDLDLFIHGIDPADRRALWLKLDEIVRRLTMAFQPLRRSVITQTLAPGVVTFAAHYAGVNRYGGLRGLVEREVKIQVILRAYPSISAILHAFDVPSCSVAFDGALTYTTTLGAYAQVFRVNPVVPAYRSTTYESRLAKYFDRGFALALLDLKPGSLVKGELLELPHLTLVPHVTRGRFAVGTIALPANAPAPGSDYGGPRLRRDLSSVISLYGYGQHWTNTRQLASGRYNFVRWKAIDDLNEDNIINFIKYAESPPTLAQILPRERLEAVLTAAAKNAIDLSGRVNVSHLRRVFDMSGEEISRFISAVAETQSRFPERRLDASPALARFRAALLDRYDQLPPEIPWWIVHDPGRQFTASLNPRMENPAQWYGDAFASEPVSPSPDDYVEALLATLEARQGGLSDPKGPVYDGLCPLCQEPIKSGEANSLVLPCGHTYHWVGIDDDENDCAGLYAWVVEGHSDCPTCRHNFERAGRDEPAAEAAVAVDIAW